MTLDTFAPPGPHASGSFGSAAVQLAVRRSVALAKTYGVGQAAVHALAGITATFDRGRFTAVMGPSGSGKSTWKWPPGRPW